MTESAAETNAEKLRDRRSREGLTLAEAGKQFGVEWWKYRRWELDGDEGRTPDLHDALMLERVWGVPADAWPRREKRKTKRSARRTGRAA